ncbi:aminotransferase class V-fold PLP-dependent enzyme [candidate division GN15 bacterium]|nr:aminotransferase class V-fold PLP-dependent enzyme [candidate division GN15 bacterium]
MPVTKTSREAPIELAPDEFRALGHDLIDQIADFLATLPERPVTSGESPRETRKALQADNQLPSDGTSAGPLLQRATHLLRDHSLFNSHPRFWGYITAPAAPLGILGDLLASAMNPNCGGWALSPMASEIEAQTVRWIGELIGFPADGGLMVSGGNMANFVGFLAARSARFGETVRTAGMGSGDFATCRMYTSAETHTWVQKAADLFGFGTDAIRWIETDGRQRMKVTALRQAIEADRAEGHRPFLVIGTAGSVSTGAIDPLREIAEACREFDLWFHIDGAYGGFAACVPDSDPEFAAFASADSIAVDPHKWLYAPLEAGCALVRDAATLRGAFSYRPPYYHFSQEEEEVNFVDFGLQNSRGFRALKVWLLLQQCGREGYARMIRNDIDLAEQFYRSLDEVAELESVTCDLSIVTFRYVPSDLADRTDAAEVAEYLNELNETLLTTIQDSGEAFVSNAVIHDRFLLRLCICNFRTTAADLAALPEIVTRLGGTVDRELRQKHLP